MKCQVYHSRLGFSFQVWDCLAAAWLKAHLVTNTFAHCKHSGLPFTLWQQEAFLDISFGILKTV